MKAYIQNTSTRIYYSYLFICFIVPLDKQALKSIQEQINIMIVSLSRSGNISGLDVYLDHYMDIYNKTIASPSSYSLMQFVTTLYITANMVLRNDKDFKRPLIKTLLSTEYKKIFTGKERYVDIAIFQLAAAIISKANDRDKIRISQAIIKYSILYIIIYYLLI